MDFLPILAVSGLHAKFWAGVGVAAAPYILAAVLIGLTYLAMRFLMKRKEQVIYVEIAVKVLKAIFGDKLGGKADEFFDEWLECLEKVRNGEWTVDQMVDEFCKIIVTSKNIELTQEDIDKVKEVTNQSMSVLHIQNTNKNQVSLMSVYKK